MLAAIQKKAPILLSTLIMLAVACKNGPHQTACGTQVCTDLFATITVTFTDNSGTPIAIQNLKVVDQRTGDTVFNQLPSTTTGNYVIASDSNLKLLSPSGDDLQVSATDAATCQTKVVTLKVAGGTCACHVSKLSGPDTVTFN